MLSVLMATCQAGRIAGLGCRWKAVSFRPAIHCLTLFIGHFEGFPMTSTSSTPFPLGAFVGNPNIDNPGAEAVFDASAETFDSLMGTQPAYMNSYIDFTQPIGDWLDNTGWSAASFRASPTASGTIPTIGLPMASTAAGSPSADQMYQNFVSGDYDGILQAMVKTWADNGYMTQVWRPGVEMNLNSSPSYGGTSPGEQADWIAAFQHIYTVLHAAAQADGVNLQVVWNPATTNDTAAGNATQTLYPGSQYVDVIGADVYSDIYPFSLYDWDKSGQQINSPNPVYDSSLQTWASDPVNLEHYYTDPASDQWSLDGSGGSALSLQSLIDFAKAQGKPIAIPETGAGNTADGAGVSDNPTFVHWLSSTLGNAGVPVDYVSIWDSNGNGDYEFSNASDGKSQEAAAWAQYFGAQSTSTAPTTSIPTTAASTSAAAASAPSTDTLALNISEDPGNADAAFTVSVDGQQVGGDYTASALHSSGDSGTFLLTGDWGSAVNDVQVSFINDANGTAPGAGQNLYVDSMAYDGVTYAGTTAALLGNTTGSFAVGGTTPTASGPADTLTLNLTEDAANGNAQFVLYIDGKAVTTPQQVTASKAAGATEAFSYSGNLGAGTHTIGVGFVNDAYYGPGDDRNLYIDGVALNGASVFSGVQGQYGNGVSNFTVTTAQ
jgi:hypothetical protein